MAKPSTTRAARRRRWRGIRPRLVAALLIPTLAALALGGLRVASAVEESQAATRAASLANALPDSFALALQLEVERDTGSLDKVPEKTLAAVHETTDSAIQVWEARQRTIDASRDAKLSQDLRVVREALDGIAGLRQQLADPATREAAQATYTDSLDILIGLAGRLPGLGGDPEIYRQAAALGQVRAAAEALATQRVLVGQALAAEDISRADLVTLATAMQSYLSASGFYYKNTSQRAQRAFDDINGVMGGPVGSHAPMQDAVATLVSTGDPHAVRMTAQEWTSAYADFLRQIVSVVSMSATDLAGAVDEKRAVAQRDAIVSAAGVLLVLLLALVASAVFARSLLRPLHRLREGALEIARHGLPERVRALEESDQVGDLSVAPIEVGSRDEIAEVGAAFDAVHAEAVRLAGEQAQMRANVSKMFVNLSRRSQSLVERQLRLIDELESGEQDPEHLANLFRLDHLATRMRRNDESLMVLAGDDTGQAARGPVPVLDVLRAASSEVEQFARVEIESAETAKFRGSVAGDLVHLLAELVENATNFSPPDSPVVVRSSRTSAAAPLVIEVRDLGIGMTPPELEAANAKLRSAGGLDADVARMMGLVVASRLADRHGLSVELRANSPRGVVARVEVPTSVLVQPETPSAPLVDPVGPVDPGDPLAGPVDVPVGAPSPAEPAERVAPAEPVARREPATPAQPVASAAAPAEPLTGPEQPSAPSAPSGGTPVLPKRQPAPVAGSFPPPQERPAVRPPEGYTPPATPVASEPPVKSWFTSTVPLRDPEELLNTYLTGRAEGVDGAIRNPLGAIAKRGAGLPPRVPLPEAPPETAPEARSEARSEAPAATSPVAQPAPLDEPPAPPLTSSGLPTRVPLANLPGQTEFDPFGAGTPAPTGPTAPTPETAVEEPAAPVLDPLIAELAADVLSAPSAEEALAGLDDADAADDDTSIFATLQSEWFTRRTPLEARRSQSEPDASAAEEADPTSSDWVSPGDEGWRRAAEVADPAALEEGAPRTVDGLPMRIPGRALVPGSAAPAPATPAAPVTPENVVPLPRLERRRTRGLASFQQGVSRARTGDAALDDLSDTSPEITVPGAQDAPQDRAHEEHQ